MKRIGIVIVSLCLAGALIVTGFFIKEQQGYTLETEEEIVQAVSQVINLPKERFQLSRSFQYENQKNDTNFMIVFVESGTGYYVSIFKQKENGKYDFYNRYETTDKDNAGVLIDPQEGYGLIWYKNMLGKVKSCEIVWNNHQMTQHRFSLEDGRLICEVIEAKSNEINQILFIDEKGDTIGVSYSIDTISQEG